MTASAKTALQLRSLIKSSGELEVSLVSEPVHVVTDSYSWVAQRFEK